METTETQTRQRILRDHALTELFNGMNARELNGAADSDAAYGEAKRLLDVLMAVHEAARVSDDPRVLYIEEIARSGLLRT